MFFQIYMDSLTVSDQIYWIINLISFSNADVTITNDNIFLL